jgi:hypothetical protein
MRLHRGVPTLAAVLTLIGSSAPAAHGFELAGAPTPSPGHNTVAQRQSSGSDDWAVEIGAVGAVTVLATAAAVARRRHAPTSRRARTAP